MLGIRHVELLDPGARLRGVVAFVHAQELHAVVPVVTRQAHELGLLVAAGIAPRRPEVHDDDAAAEVGERERFAVDRVAGQRGSGLLHRLRPEEPIRRVTRAPTRAGRCRQPEHGCEGDDDAPAAHADHANRGAADAQPDGPEAPVAFGGGSPPGPEPPAGPTTTVPLMVGCTSQWK